MADKVKLNDEEYTKEEILATWNSRRTSAEQDRQSYLTQVKVNRKFAAGKQHLDVHLRDGRVIDVRYRNGIKLVTSDILTQYLLNAVGRMSAQDYRPNFVVSADNEQSEYIAKHLNMSFGWGWENEWHGDKRLLQVWRLLVIDGTAAIRCRYDRSVGEVVGDVPYREGKPILDKEEARSYVADEASKGRRAELKTLREGRVVWEVLTFNNLLPPPGFDNPEDFPWEIVQRPVPVDDLKKRYPKEADGIEAEDIESTGAITSGLGMGEAKEEKMKDRVMLYTGYQRPDNKHKKGLTVIFTKDRLLETRNHLPYADHPRGPATGLHYFRWQILPGRFWGKAFIENGIGPQKVRNKRLTQIDAIIDRNLPKVFVEENSLSLPQTGEPNEVVPVRQGAPLPKVEQGVPPGAWMLQDVKLQEENAERAMGMRSVSLGAPPAGVTAYSALALLNENNALQFDAIATEFRNEVIDLSWDTVETMKHWPTSKTLLLAGPEGRLQSVLWDRNWVPMHYLVRPPRGGALPRSQAAELQKITDLFGVIQRSPLFAPRAEEWINWYKESLDTGKVQDFPPSLGDQQAHKAELENITMASTLQSPPVAEYDDDIRHVEIHRAFQVPLRALADQGDEKAAQQVEVLEQHIREHLGSAEAEVQSVQPQETVGGGGGGMASPGSAVPPLPSLDNQVSMESQLGRPM